MSQYVPLLENLAKELMGIQNSKELLQKFAEERQSAMGDVIRKIFEEGIIPVAKDQGYKLMVDVGHPASYNFQDWEMFVNAAPFLKHILKIIMKGDLGKD